MKMNSNKLSLLFFCYICLVTLINGANDNERKIYIIYMGELPEDRLSAADEHRNLLLETIGNEKVARESKIHSYGQSFNGFVARLLPQEANRLSQKKGVVSVFPNTIRKLHTTRSWDFLGMPETVKRNHEVESNTIVALLDTGIWVRSPSFNDKGYGPPPPKWKGKCDKGANFTGCNNKVIGARYFNLEGGVDEEITPVDLDGHGTHTASTAAGIPVHDASLFGIAKGTARGGVPSARIASYKVCWGMGCQDMDLLAGFDAAIADGVDIISVSIGGPSRRFFEDTIAIGAFHAMKKGILTSCAGGNDGPDFSTIENVAPWIMTVAASSIDRQLVSSVKLGVGKTISGISINTFKLDKQMYPLLNGARAANTSSEYNGNVSACDYGTLSASKVKGKIIYCRGMWNQDSTIRDLGGVGTIMSTEQLTDTAFAYVIPATSVSVADGQQIDKYINSTKDAKAVICKTRSANMTAPFIASFSSRGPQMITLNILKPDIAAPGLSILAAYSQLVSVTGDIDDKRYVKYTIESGTSMACPHAASAAAYVKTFHPNWSAAALRSALMTTAKSMKIKPIGTALASGAGLINPRRALDPGLIYDIDVNSYISFLCKEGYSSPDIGLITGNKMHNCSSFPSAAKGTDGLNYPSMHVQLENLKSNISAVFYRTATYVGEGKTVYRSKVKSPKGLSVTVVPNYLSFTKQYQKKSFKVMLKGNFLREKSWFISASLVWSNCRHNVKSPILVYRPIA